MKKLIAMILALSMVLSLAACGGGSQDEPNSGNETSPVESISASGEPVDSEAEPSDNAVYIAILEPMSGSNATNGELSVKGLDMYVDYYMEKYGGIQSMDGAEIILDLYDTCSDKETAITLFEQIVEDEKYSAVIGPYQSGVGIVLAPLAIEYEMPFMVINCTSDTVMTNGENKYVYRTNIGSFDGDPGMQELFTFLDEQLPNGLNSVAMLYNDDDWGSAALKITTGLCEMYDIDLVVSEQIAADVSDLTTVVNKVKNSGADLVMTALYQDAHELLSNTMYEYDCDLLTVSYGGGTSADTFLQNVGEAGENIIQVVGWAPTYMTSDEANAINDAYYAENHQNLTQEICWAWLGLGALIEGIEEAGSADREAIADALYAMDISAEDGYDMFMFSYYLGVKYATEGQINTQDGTTRYNNNEDIGDAAGQCFCQVIDGEWVVVGPQARLEGESPISIPDSYYN